MKLSSNTILITGGGSGIGYGLAERFLKAGSRVIICGRDIIKLAEVKIKYPEVYTVRCDISSEKERIYLRREILDVFPDLNVLVNNAGIQQRINITEEPEWDLIKKELEINLLAQIHLTALFIPHLKKAVDPAIMNVTSGLSFAPLASVPVYSTSKAGFHSFTLSLRHQLANTNIKVIEIIPPAVQTDLGGKGLHDFGTPLNEFSDAVIKGLEKGKEEISYGFSANSSRASREELDEIFKRMNSR
jgi:uncharacterized oxidoreductase